MSADSIIKAWKDQDYRSSLSDGARSLIPENPAGLIELTDEALDEIVAGAAEAGSCCWRSCNTKEVTPVEPAPAPAPAPGEVA